MNRILPRVRLLLAEIQNCRAERDTQQRIASTILLLPKVEELLNELVNCYYYVTSTSERAQARALVLQRLKTAREACWELNREWDKDDAMRMRLSHAPVTRTVNQLLQAIEQYERLLKLPERC